jgi:hypothetical protein
VFYATGESSMGRIRFQARQDYPDMSDGVLAAWPFTEDNVDILAEVKNQRTGYSTIKDYAIARLSADSTIEFIIDDDRAGEVADLVTVGRSASGTVRIGFYHCKASAEDNAGVRVVDLYEVVGQAEKSVRWLDVSRLAKRLLDRLASGSRVVYGQSDALTSLLDGWAKAAAPAGFVISIVQPGLVVGRVNASQNAKVVLNDALEWINQHDADFLVIGQ